MLCCLFIFNSGDEMSGNVQFDTKLKASDPLAAFDPTSVLSFKSEELQKRSDIIKHNMQMIWNRQKGEKFYVAQDGRLQKLSFWGRIVYYICARKSIDARVCLVFTETLGCIENKKVDDDDLLGVAGAKFWELFIKKIGHLSHTIFIRSAALNDDCKQALAYYFYHSERMEIVNKQRHMYGHKQKDDPSFVEYCFEIQDSIRSSKELDVAEALGGRSLTLIKGGSSGVYKGQLLNGQDALVFKPRGEGPYGHENPKLFTKIKRVVQRLFNCCGGNLQRDSLYADTEYFSEVFAFRTALWIKTKTKSEYTLVPPTFFKTFTSQAFSGRNKTKIGSCQEWVTGWREASQYAPSWNLWWLGKGVCYLKGSDRIPVNQDQFEDFLILDYVIGNQDRDTDNFGLKEWDNKEKVFKQIVAFDNSFAFPKKHPEGVLSTRKMHLPALLANARRGFSERGLQLIEMFKKEQDDLFKELELQTDSDGKPLLTPAQKETARDRIEALYRHFVVNKGNNPLMSDLWHMKDRAYFESNLNRDQQDKNKIRK